MMQLLRTTASGVGGGVGLVVQHVTTAAAVNNTGELTVPAPTLGELAEFLLEEDGAFSPGVGDLEREYGEEGGEETNNGLGDSVVVVEKPGSSYMSFAEIVEGVNSTVWPAKAEGLFGPSTTSQAERAVVAVWPTDEDEVYGGMEAGEAVVDGFVWLPETGAVER